MDADADDDDEEEDDDDDDDEEEEAEEAEEEDDVSDDGDDGDDSDSSSIGPKTVSLRKEKRKRVEISQSSEDSQETRDEAAALKNLCHSDISDSDAEAEALFGPG